MRRPFPIEQRSLRRDTAWRRDIVRQRGSRGPAFHEAMLSAEEVKAHADNTMPLPLSLFERGRSGFKQPALAVCFVRPYDERFDDEPPCVIRWNDAHASFGSPGFGWH